MYDHRAQIILRFWISKAIVNSSTATSVVSNLKVACQIDDKRIETYISNAQFQLSFDHSTQCELECFLFNCEKKNKEDCSLLSDAMWQQVEWPGPGDSAKAGMDVPIQ